MKEKLLELKSLIENKESAKSTLKDFKDKFDEENALLIQSIKYFDANIDDLKKELTKNALDGFAVDHEKTRLGGIKVQESNIISYSDKDALTWCETNMPIAVSKIYNEKMFKEHLKNNDIDFVTKELVTKVTFPKVIKLEAE